LARPTSRDIGPPSGAERIVIRIRQWVSSTGTAKPSAFERPSVSSTLGTLITLGSIQVEMRSIFLPSSSSRYAL
jgi:hypothetical protein